MFQVDLWSLWRASLSSTSWYGSKLTFASKSLSYDIFRIKTVSIIVKCGQHLKWNVFWCFGYFAFFVMTDGSFERESIVFWNRLLCCSPLDLTEAKLQQVVVKIRSTGHVDPKLIVKHPELLPAIPFDLVSCNCGSPAYFDVLSMYAIHFRGSRDSDILDRFLVHLNLDPENEELTLKSQFADPFCSVINGLEETSTSWPLIHPFFKCLVERKVEPLSLRLRTLRCLCDKFEQEVSNVVLLDIFETAMTESDAKSLQFIVDFFFQLNHHRLDKMWTSVYGKCFCDCLKLLFRESTFCFVEVFMFHGANRILFSASRKWLKIECWGVILRLETWQIMITYEPLENDNRIRKTIQFETVLRLTIIFESMEFVSIISNIYNSLIPGSDFNFFNGALML